MQMSILGVVTTCLWQERRTSIGSQLVSMPSYIPLSCGRLAFRLSRQAIRFVRTADLALGRGWPVGHVARGALAGGCWTIEGSRAA